MMISRRPTETIKIINFLEKTPSAVTEIYHKLLTCPLIFDSEHSEYACLAAYKEKIELRDLFIGILGCEVRKVEGTEKG